jgi:hypothetical protein
VVSIEAMFNSITDHSFDCVFRTSGGRGTPRVSNQKKIAAREAQQRFELSFWSFSITLTESSQNITSRPSPWPGVQQNGTPQSLNEAIISTQPCEPSQNRSPGLLSGDNIAPETPKVSTTPDKNSSSKHSLYLLFRKSKVHKSLGPASQVGDAASRDGLSGVNLHTNGTEFYGNSSNLAFLGNLYARAQNQADIRNQDRIEDGASQPSQNSPVNHPNQPFSPGTSDHNSRKSGKSQLSIVNLLYNADYPGHSLPQSHNKGEAAVRAAPSVQVDSRKRSRPVENGKTP